MRCDLAYWWPTGARKRHYTTHIIRTHIAQYKRNAHHTAYIRHRTQHTDHAQRATRNIHKITHDTARQMDSLTDRYLDSYVVSLKAKVVENLIDDVLDSLIERYFDSYLDGLIHR